MTDTEGVTIPAFVIRGLSKFQDVSDIGSVRFGPEADLRDALATHWWMQGLGVQVEIDVPKCGRIDVLGRIGNVQMLVELKREIRTPSTARKALSQAANYKRFLDHENYLSNSPLRTHAYVTCGLANWSVLHEVAPVFVDVTVDHFVSLAGEPTLSYLTRDLLPYMREIAQARSEVVHQLGSALRSADRNLCTALEAQKGIAA